jgi:succinate dehydrogenase/fumarate reductase cytochrome b subunit
MTPKGSFMSLRLAFVLITVLLAVVTAGCVGLTTYIFNRDTGTPPSEAARKGAFACSATLGALFVVLTFIVVAGGVTNEANAMAAPMPAPAPSSKITNQVFVLNW